MYLFFFKYVRTQTSRQVLFPSLQTANSHALASQRLQFIRFIKIYDASLKKTPPPPPKHHAQNKTKEKIQEPRGLLQPETVKPSHVLIPFPPNERLARKKPIHESNRKRGICS